jgi:hypothetical protein
MSLPLSTNPRDLLLGPNNDLVVTTDLQFTYGIAAVAQSCRIALQMFAGEWFLNLDAGIPYWQAILGFKPATAIAAAQIAFRQQLLAVDGVLDVLVLNIPYTGTTRTMNVQWQVSTGLGDTPVDTIQLSIATGISSSSSAS